MDTIHYLIHLDDNGALTFALFGFLAIFALAILINKSSKKTEELEIVPEKRSPPKILTELADLYKNLSPETKESIANSVASSVSRSFASATDHIAVTESAIVTWRYYGTKMFGATDEQIISTSESIKSILAANPNVDLHRFKGPLGIEIVDIQQTAKNNPPHPKGFMG